MTGSYVAVDDGLLARGAWAGGPGSEVTKAAPSGTARRKKR